MAEKMVRHAAGLGAAHRPGADGMQARNAGSKRGSKQGAGGRARDTGGGSGRGQDADSARGVGNKRGRGQGTGVGHGRRTNKLACLLSVQLRGLFGFNRILHGGSRRDRVRLALLAAGVLLCAGVFAVYGWAMAEALVHIGAAGAVPVLAVAIASCAGLAMTFLKANGLLFGFRDFDLVMSLPVAHWQIALSRVAPLYGMNLALGIAIALPMTVVWGMAVGAGAGTYLLALAALLLAPLLPMALAVGLSWLVAVLAARMRRGKVAVGVAALALVAAVVVGIMALSGTLSSPEMADMDLAAKMGAVGQMGQALSDAVAAAYPPAAWAAAGLVRSDGAAFALFAAVSLAVAAGVVAVLARGMLPVNALLEVGGGRARVGAGAYRKRSARAAQVGKEFRLLVATPAYLMNTAVGPVLALALGIACLVASPADIAGTLASGSFAGMDPAALADGIVGMLPWAVAFCVLITPMSASSISLEGAARWVMQTAPVETRTIVDGKALANFLLCGPAGVVGGVLAGIGCGAGPAQMAAFVGAPLAGAALSSCLGVFLDVRRPRYDWTSEYEVVKRSFAVMASVFIGLAVAGAGVAIGLATGAWAPAASLALVVGMLVAAGLLLRAAGRADLRD